MSEILHGGRLGKIRADVAKFTSSIEDDARILRAVVAINKAHVVMIAEQKIITQKDASALLAALNNASDLPLGNYNEDVHMAIEEVVLKEAGSETGGNLHIAKSRNDQVATAIRIQLRNELLSLLRSLTHLQEHMVEVAENHLETVILEYTHLQPAQPVTFAHYILSYVDALERDAQRLQNVYARVNLCPLGAGALATTSFPINRDRTAALLGFSGLVENSIDAVGSRDFIAETIANLTLVAVNLSRLAEDFIIWSSSDFGVVELPDEFTSTSSIMPQKKNPELLEVIRARASDILANFVATTAVIKSLPSTYNLDFQEVTPKLWKSLDSVRASLDMMHKLIPKLKVNPSDRNKTLKSYVSATELANILVRKYNVPFRSAHKIVGTLVKELIQSKSTFADVSPQMLQKVAAKSTGIKIAVQKEDLDLLANPLKLVETCNVKGGPAPIEVKRALFEREKQILCTKSNISKLDKDLEEAENKLETVVQQRISNISLERNV